MSPRPNRSEAENQLAEEDLPAPPTGSELDEIRRLFLGYEEPRLDELLGWLNDPHRRALEISRVLPRAVRLRPDEDDQLAEALAPSVALALSDLARRDPQALAQVLAPVVGKALRGAASAALQRRLRTLRRASSAPGLRWLVEAWREGESFAEIADRHTLVYRIEHLCLVHRASGQLLLQVSAPHVPEAPYEQMAHLLTGVQQMLRGSDDREAPKQLRSLDRKIVVEQGSHLALAAVVSGQAPETLRDRLQATLDTIHLERGMSLKLFNGDTSPFELNRAQLEKCLDAEYEEPPSHLLAAGALILAAAIAVGAAAWIFLRG